MNRYWISWWSGNYADEGCTQPEPGTFLTDKFWISGQRDRQDYGLSEKEYAEYLKIEDEDEMDSFLDNHSKDDCSICAVIDAESPEKAFEVIRKFFPDAVPRFCEPRAADFDPAKTPGGRFQ